MRNSRVRDVAAFFRLLATFAVASVGGSMNSTQNRVLQSMTVSPASADAQTFPQGQVQFTATGTFSQAPSIVSSNSAVGTHMSTGVSGTSQLTCP